MAAAPLSRDLALRIGLAARALPETSPARLLRVLEDAVGLPPTATGLAKLTVKDLRQAAAGEFAEMEGWVLKQALTLLQGGVMDGSETLPALESPLDSQHTGFIQVACASNNGEALDGHFGSCQRFLIYQVAPGSCRLIALRACVDTASGEDKTNERVQLIRDCQVLYVASIGGQAAAKVIKAGIHPVKFPQGGAARLQIEALAQVLATAPPPWLAKAIGLLPLRQQRCSNS